MSYEKCVVERHQWVGFCFHVRGDVEFGVGEVSMDFCMLRWWKRCFMKSFPSMQVRVPKRYRINS